MILPKYNSIQQQYGNSILAHFCSTPYVIKPWLCNDAYPQIYQIMAQYTPNRLSFHHIIIITWNDEGFSMHNHILLRGVQSTPLLGACVRTNSLGTLGLKVIRFSDL